MLLAELNIKEEHNFRRIPDFCLYSRMLFETREITSMTRRRWRLFVVDTIWVLGETSLFLVLLTYFEHVEGTHSECLVRRC
jgi:hypothetical protein